MGHPGAANEKGFTLIELLITVTIIGILAAIATPNLINGQRRARYSAAAADTRQIIVHAQVLTSDTNQVADTVCGNPMPACLWDGSAPFAVIYMTPTTDPWAPPGTNYQWNQVPAVGCAVATPGCVVYSAWTMGSEGVPAAWNGIVAPGGDDLGNSTLLGCAFGPVLPVASPC